MRYVIAGIVALALLSGACTFGKTKAELANEAVQRGLQAQGQGRIEDAAAAYHDALDLDPRNKFAVFNLGVIDQGAGRARSAENYYRLALGIDPDFVPAMFNLAILRTAAGDTGEALQLYRHAAALQPNDANVHQNLGSLLISLGQQDEGEAEVGRAANLRSGAPAPR